MRRKKRQPWRLPRVRQALPHLSEIDQYRSMRWIVLGGVFLILAVYVGAVVVPNFTRTVSPAGVTSQPTPTPVQAILSPIPNANPATVPAPTVVDVKYRVKAGDTLSAIAQKYKVTVASIIQANRLKNDTIYVGQELIIPPIPPTPTPSP